MKHALGPGMGGASETEQEILTAGRRQSRKLASVLLTSAKGGKENASKMDLARSRYT